MGEFDRLIEVFKALDFPGFVLLWLFLLYKGVIRWGKDAEGELEAERKITALETARADKAETALAEANAQFLSTNNQFLAALREQAARIQERGRSR